MVRKVGFGDNQNGTDPGPVSRGGPPRKPVKQHSVSDETDPVTPKTAPEDAAIPDPASPAASAPKNGKPRWGAMLVLLVLLTAWLFMFAAVVAGILQRMGSGVPWTHMLWVALSVYGTIVLIRKLRHMYRGGSWLQTPDDAARKSAGDDA